MDNLELFFDSIILHGFNRQRTTFLYFPFLVEVFPFK